MRFSGPSKIKDKNEMPFFEPGKNVTMRYMFNAGEAGEPKNNSDEDVVGESSKDSGGKSGT